MKMGRTLMNGTEIVLYESTEIGEYHGYIFVNNLAGTDSIDFKFYVRNPEDDTYYLADALTVTGVQATPVVRVSSIVNKSGVKISATQTVGTYRNIDHAWFKK
jgi:hypothetical protein